MDKVSYVLQVCIVAGRLTQPTTPGLRSVNQSLNTADQSSSFTNIVGQLLDGKTTAKDAAGLGTIQRLSPEQVEVLLSALTQLNDKVTTLTKVVGLPHPGKGSIKIDNDNNQPQNAPLLIEQSPSLLAKEATKYDIGSTTASANAFIKKQQ